MGLDTRHCSSIQSRELFFRGGQKGASYSRGDYSRDGELLFRVGCFAKKFTFSIQVDISHDD